MHETIDTVVIDRRLADCRPGLAREIFNAYALAKKAAYRRRLGTTLMPWAERRWDETMELFGGDPLPHGSTPANRNQVSMLVRHLQEQRLIQRSVAVDELFTADAGAFAE